MYNLNVGTGILDGVFDRDFWEILLGSSGEGFPNLKETFSFP
jgi:hypothetical protein